MQIVSTILDKFKGRFPKEKFSLGLDIGTSAVKAVKLRMLKENIELCGFDTFPVENNLIEVIKTIIKSQNMNVVNISVSGPLTIIRYMEFPKMQPEELKQALKFEAQKHIPFPIEEVHLDAHILKNDLPDNKMMVLIAAVKNEFISQRLELMKDAQAIVNVIDIDSLALINIFNHTKVDNIENKAIALINIGAAEINLNILENGIPLLSRDMHVGGNKFTQRIVESFELDFKTAEAKKLDFKQEDAEKIKQSWESVFISIINEVRVSLDYYESQSSSSVTKIFISGGGSLLRELKDNLAKAFEIQVDYWDPFKQMNISDKLDLQKLKAVSSQLAVAGGLALRQ
ncbi:MAG: type IV pilus assembly protein PilM [Candidatus Omnitrophota bacterium]